MRMGNFTEGNEPEARKEITVFPNPTSDVATINGLEELSTITVLNVSGQIVLSKKAETTNEKIDLGDLDNGIYMVLIQNETGATVTKQKVVLAK